MLHLDGRPGSGPDPLLQLAAIYSHVLGVEREQSDIEQALDHIEQQQKDLLSTLDAYERSVGEVLGGQGGSIRALDTGPADTERDKKCVSCFILNAVRLLTRCGTSCAPVTSSRPSCIHTSMISPALLLR